MIRASFSSKPAFFFRFEPHVWGWWDIENAEIRRGLNHNPHPNPALASCFTSPLSPLFQFSIFHQPIKHSERVIRSTGTPSFFSFAGTRREQSTSFPPSCLPTYLPTYLPTFLSVCLSVCLSPRPCFWLSVSLASACKVYAKHTGGKWWIWFFVPFFIGLKNAFYPTGPKKYKYILF